MRRVVLPTALILFFAFSGCFGSKKNPVKAPVNPPFAYSRATPQDVLGSLVHAYEARDSTQYSKLYAYDYQGTSYDVSGLFQPGTFTWADEVAHIKALAESPDILRITLNLGPTSSWIRTVPPGPNDEGWAEIAIPSPHLEIYGVGGDGVQIVPNETFIFEFSPETPAAGSPTDTLWSIVRWSEVGPPGP